LLLLAAFGLLTEEKGDISALLHHPPAAAAA
jgi:hypothetical protein